MRVIDISSECLERDYHGCGKAWGALRDGVVVAIRYMDHAADWPTEPAWVRAVREHATGLGGSLLPTCHGSHKLAAMAAAAQACDDCPRPPKRDRYRPAELLTMARAAMAAVQSASFARYREQCRAELAAIGEVVSGECSCTKFCAK